MDMETVYKTSCENKFQTVTVSFWNSKNLDREVSQVLSTC